MQIATNKVVTIDYVLKDPAGNLIDSSEGGDFAYLHGAGNIIPGLENALAGKVTGEEITVSIAPADAYGEHDDTKRQVVPREMFPTDEPIDAGMRFHAQMPNGGLAVVTITAVEGDEITIDGNHPLAGIDLHFNVRVIDVRDATAEELAHGHVHGAGGHHHD